MTRSSCEKRQQSFGTWPSPLSPQALGTGAHRLAFATSTVGGLLWLEGRPQEGGRNALMRDRGEGPVDLLPPSFNVRSRVHEYGGRPFATDGARIWFVDDATQHVWELDEAGACHRIADPGPWRLAELVYDRDRRRLLAVGERHESGLAEPQNALVALDLASGRIQALVEGHDFFAAPCLDPSGSQLAYLAWDHPDMPWDAAGLWVVSLTPEGTPGAPVHVAGDGEASVFGPTWSTAGTLAFAWEVSGHWNLFSWRSGGAVEPLLEPMDAECALPLWQLGMSAFGWLGDDQLIAALTREGRWQVALVDVSSRSLMPLVDAYSSVSHLHAGGGRAVMIAASPERPAAVIEVERTGSCRVVRSSMELTPDVRASLSVPQAMSFATAGAHTAHGFFYPPFNAGFDGPSNERPPLLVMAHGGPTAAASPAFNPAIQFWTTRGFAVLDVNYRGSTGYGRAFRALLNGQWGVADVEDCVAGARHLADAGLVDGRRMAIRGSSAGGLTVLAALIFHDVFAAGASLYGVADLEALVRDTHKFESRYLDRLVAPHPARADVYRDRSPMHAVDRLTKPVIFFQGLQDKVVPPSQAEAMVAALRARGVPVEYLAFDGEQHGFRKAETVRRVHEAELAFYGRVFGFVPSP